MSEWYVAVDGKQQGPFTEAEVIERIRRGQLGRNAHVFTQGMANWEPIGSRQPFAAALGVTDGVAAAAAARMGAHEIDYEIFGEEMQFVEITLDPGEACIAEAGSFMYMDPGIQMETIFGDGSGQSASGGFMGKLLSAGKRVLTGESLFMTVFGNGAGQRQKVAFAAPYPGSIVALDLRRTAARCSARRTPSSARPRGSRSASRSSASSAPACSAARASSCRSSTATASPSCTPAAPSWSGRCKPGETLRLDTGCLVAFETTVQYDIQMVSGIKTAFFGGEGLFYATLTGPGRMWMQSLPFSRLASRVLGGGAAGGRQPGGAGLGARRTRRPGDGGSQLESALLPSTRCELRMVLAPGESALHDGRFDLEHPTPRRSEVLGEVELAEDLADLVAADVGPDVVPLRVAEQVGDRPGATRAIVSAEDRAQLRLGQV